VKVFTFARAEVGAACLRQTLQAFITVTSLTTGRKVYVYSYDELFRLKNAVFSEYTE
jgi:hypothetical protein